MSTLGLGSKTQTSTGKAPYTDTVDELQDVFSSIPDRPTLKLMTFDELKTRVSRKGKGPTKRQHTYKALKDKLDMVEQALANATLESVNAQGGAEEFRKNFNSQLEELSSALTTYQKRHKGKKARTVQPLHDEIVNLRDEMDRVLKALETEKGKERSTRYPQSMRVDDALVIKPGQLKGISFSHCQFDKYNPSMEKPPPKKVLGKGAVNEVMQINYTDGGHVFKEEQTKDKSGAWAPGMLGIDPDNPRYGNRNVASGLVAGLLGTPVLDQCTFAINGDKVGLLMKKAPGNSPKAWQKESKAGPIPLDDLSPKALASLQKQMMDLEACDLVTGQGDRHYDNYMIDVNGDEVTVRGIDNDFAFGTSNEHGIPLKMPFIFRNITNMPKLMGREMAEKIKNLDFDRDMVPQFGELLEEDAIAAAKERFVALQNHVRVLEDAHCIVDDWEKWRSDPGDLPVGEFLAPKDENDSSSYFGRDLHKLITD